jgi:hypothetical protein
MYPDLTGASFQRPYSPLYSSEQVDQLILQGEAKATLMVKKKPRIVRKPIFALDKDGDKIPVLNSDGSVKLTENGEWMFQIKEYEEFQDGWESELEQSPASEIFNVDGATSNISMEAVKVLTLISWHYNNVLVHQQITKKDYSAYLHKLRNDYLSVLKSAQSFNGGTIQAIKTFITKTDSKQWLQSLEEEQKKSLNPFAFLFGGNKKKQPSQQSNTAYQQP